MREPGSGAVEVGTTPEWTGGLVTSGAMGEC